MNKRKITKQRKRIMADQEKYEKLRKKAYQEVKVLEEYFSKRHVVQEKIYFDIIRHLEAQQKESSYFGLRGVLLGVVTTIFVYIFNTGIMSQLLKLKISTNHWVVSTISISIIMFILAIFFLVMYFIGAGQFFIDDFNIRKRLYINEYMIKIVQEKIEEIKVKKKE